MNRIAMLLIDHADGPIMWTWMAVLIGFVLAARADWPLADWLLPLAVLPLAAIVAMLAIALARRLLGR